MNKELLIKTYEELINKKDTELLDCIDDFLCGYNKGFLFACQLIIDDLKNLK